jgi:hypothetical protein
MSRPDVTTAEIRRFPAAGLALLVCAASGCASNQLQPTLVSSSDTTGYAVRYPEALAAEAASFAEHKRRAHELSAGLGARVRELKPSDDRALLLRIVEQADADGKRESFARAQRSDRLLRAFWDEERGPISARVAGATQKQISEANCTVADTQPAVQQALRAGYDRQLERRLRTHSEAQRMLDTYRTRLSPATLAAMQRLVDEIALDSYLVNVALVEDINALNQRTAELDSVEATLKRSAQEEQARKSAQKGLELKATEERLQQISASRAALAASRDKAQRELSDHQTQLQLARDEYSRALDAVKASLATPAAGTPSAPAVRTAGTAAAAARPAAPAPVVAPAPAPVVAPAPTATKPPAPAPAQAPAQAPTH